MNVYKRGKFSLRYRLEKWLYEDCKKDMKKVLILLMELVTALLIFLVLHILPAFFM